MANSFVRPSCVSVPFPAQTHIVAGAPLTTNDLVDGVELTTIK